jgi:hypothetical protein
LTSALSNPDDVIAVPDFLAGEFPDITSVTGAIFAGLVGFPVLNEVVSENQIALTPVLEAIPGVLRRGRA